MNYSKETLNRFYERCHRGIRKVIKEADFFSAETIAGNRYWKIFVAIIELLENTDLKYLRGGKNKTHIIGFGGPWFMDKWIDLMDDLMKQVQIFQEYPYYSEIQTVILATIDQASTNLGQFLNDIDSAEQELRYEYAIYGFADVWIEAKEEENSNE